MISLEVQSARAERARGNHHPLMALFGQRQHWIRTIADRRLGSDLLGKISASDIAQEVLIDGFQKFDGFRGSSANEFDAWLRRITLRRVGRARRKFVFSDKRRASREVPIAWASQTAGRDRSPSSILVESEVNMRVHEAFLTLKASDRTVLVLRDREELDYEEVARRLDSSVEAVRRRCARARLRLHRILEDIAP